MAQDPPVRVLVVDDEEVMQDVLSTLLIDDGYRVVVAADGEAGLERLKEDEYDLVLLDLMLPGADGLEILQSIKRSDPDLPVLMITAHATVETALEAMKNGAFDYLVKPFRNDELRLVVRRALAAHQLKTENRNLKRELRDKYRIENFIGRSDRIRAVFDLIQQVAPSRSTVLIEGESGTGKELVARAIHSSSPRVDSPFVTVSCGSLPSEMQEATLFGQVAGAYPGSAGARRGLFEMADGGSLFFDEIASIGLEVQAKLLRALQEKEVTRVGSNESVKVDVRIIVASNADLKEEADAGRFRDDLYYRLKVISVAVPPLRVRSGDVALLAAHFLKIYANENQKKVRSIANQALRALEAYSWPGNVRELENVIQKAVVLCKSDEIGPDLIADDVKTSRVATRSRLRAGSLPYKVLVDEFEREVIVDALRQCEGVQKRAAQLLDLKPTTLNEKIKRLGIRYRG